MAEEYVVHQKLNYKAKPSTLRRMVSLARVTNKFLTKELFCCVVCRYGGGGGGGGGRDSYGSSGGGGYGGRSSYGGGRQW